MKNLVIGATLITKGREYGDWYEAQPPKPNHPVLEGGGQAASRKYAQRPLRKRKKGL